MSLATSYRYEAMTVNKSLQNALQRQQERIRTDELFAARDQQAKLEQNSSLKSEWNENQEVAGAAKKALSDFNQLQLELKLASRANIMVRRAALTHLLETECRIYEKELHQLGKAFYIKRT